MSTLTTRDQVVRNVDSTHLQATSVPVERKGFSLSRLLTWYRTAVLSPVSDGEKAEWQKNSF